MRPPATAVLGHLLWSRTGRVWAIWRVRETPYVWVPLRRKHTEHARVRSLLAALPAESVILSIAARVDPGEVVDAMTNRIDLHVHQGWVDAVEATLDRLEMVDLYERRHYLCVELPEAGRALWRSWWRAASGPLRSGFGLSAQPIPMSELRTAYRQAADLETRLPVRLDRLSAGEVRWLYARATRRGLESEPPLAGWPEPRLRRAQHDGQPAVASPSLAPLLDATFHEGGSSEDQDRGSWQRRYLRVAGAGGISYQAFVAVADAPQQFVFPGGSSEWLLVADQLPFPVDWACRIRTVPNYTAGRGAARQQRELAGQAAEYDAEPAGPPPSLAAAMDAIDDERAALSANPADPELQVAMVYAVWSDDLVDLRQRVGLLQSIYRSAEFDMPTPTGGQLQLFEAMLPASATPRVCDDYKQFMLPRDLAAGMPFAGVALGDSQGMLLGATRDAGCARPVLFDPAAGPANDRDGSIAAFGALGTGKSYLTKRMAASVLLRGGQMLLVDRTQTGEYVRFAHTMDEAGVSTQVVTVGASDSLLLDPLRVFDDGHAARQAALGYLTMVCGIDPTSVEAATLSQAVQAVVDRDGQLSDVLDELAGKDDSHHRNQDARALALRLEAISQNQFGAAVWGRGRGIDPTVDCTVIHLPNLAVPGREVLLSEHLSRRMLPEQVCSLGLLYLVTALARRIAYQHPGRFAALALDEAWALTYTLPGQQLLADMVRDGRKHNAAAWLASQSPDDLPVGLRDLVSTRFLFGLTGEAARTGLRWLGVEADEVHLELLDQWASRPSPARATQSTGDTHDQAAAVGQPSECLWRDGRGRIGHVEIAEAETELLREGFESNPTRLDEPPASQELLVGSEPPPLAVSGKALPSAEHRSLTATASVDHEAGRQRP